MELELAKLELKKVKSMKMCDTNELVCILFYDKYVDLDKLPN